MLRKQANDTEVRINTVNPNYNGEITKLIYVLVRSKIGAAPVNFFHQLTRNIQRATLGFGIDGLDVVE